MRIVPKLYSSMLDPYPVELDIIEDDGSTRTLALTVEGSREVLEELRKAVEYAETWAKWQKSPGCN